MTKQEDGRTSSGAVLLAIALAVGGLTACDGLLEIELPGSITEESLDDPTQAAVLVTSAIADIECAYSDFVATNGAGGEDAFYRITGWWSGAFEYPESPGTGDCNTSATSYGWYTPLHKGRYVAERAYTAITEWDVENKNKYLAEAAIYSAVAYDLLGEFFCEVTADKGPLMSPDETLARSEEYLTSALASIEQSGDFAIAGGVAPSAKQLAYVLRARVRWARGENHWADALADAARVDKGFVAYVTRESTGPRQRSNKVVSGNNENAYDTVNGLITWWPRGDPSPIPFTGYRSLGILPDGRAVTDAGFAITTTENPTAVADVRVPVLDTETTSNGHELWTQQKYLTRDADIPLANWEEVWLIRAEIEGGQTAIDLVNEIRAYHELPLVTYLDPTNADGIEDMIFEERRRSLFLEGRFWSTKIQNQDKLWFPRGRDFTPAGHAYGNGIRMVMPNDEFELNPGLDIGMQGTLCGNEAPAA